VVKKGVRILNASYRTNQFTFYNKNT